jgi:hypothetical protein
MSLFAAPLAGLTLPALLVGALLASLLGASFHLVSGGGLLRLLLDLLLAWLGFWGGHALAAWLGWDFATLGPLRLGAAASGAVLLLLLGYWVRPRPD